MISSLQQLTNPKPYFLYSPLKPPKTPKPYHYQRTKPSSRNKSSTRSVLQYNRKPQLAGETPRVVVITSGKGGVGKTTTTANVGLSLARHGFSVVAIDADVGLRNLDLLLGLENRVNYTVIEVLNGDCRLDQALVRDKRWSNFELLCISKPRSKLPIGFGGKALVWLVDALKDRQEGSPDFILIDCPAGIDAGFITAITPANEAVLVTTPDITSLRDADRVTGLLECDGIKDIKMIVNRVRTDLIRGEDMMSVLDVQEMLGLALLGVIPEDSEVIRSTNRGFPLVLNKPPTLAGLAFEQAAWRLVEQDSMQAVMVEEEPKKHDILPPAFLTRAKKILSETSKGLQVIQTAEKSYLSAPHHAELVERRWGGSTHITVEEVKKKIADLLREYVESGDTSEACRCIRELGVPFFHHEVVKRALVLAMEIRTAEPLILKLLKEASEEGLISSSQTVKGFARLAECLEDLALDIPSAKMSFQSLVPQAISEGWLDESFLKSSGENGEVEDKDDEKIRRYKEEIVTIIHEYFLSDDIPELIRSLEDLGLPQFNPVFLKKLITLAMDRKNREKEMASVLLSALHIEIFSTEDIVNGFIMLLEAAEDTALDILDASNELALFLARAVIDDVLAPLNLEEIGSKLPSNCSGSETVHMARSLVAARHAGERILRCWGGGTGWAVEDAKDKIQKLLEEYESGGVVSEACQCIRDLGMPFFNHEVVKKALVMAMEKKNDRMLDLLQECFGEGLITINQMMKGFARIKDGLDDLALDIPNAEEKYNFYVEHAKGKGWVLPSFGSTVAADTVSTIPAAAAS